jgi:trans-aconitate methyltransferase
MLGQNWNAHDYKEYAGYVPTLGQDVLDLLAPVKGEKILDLGCGDGILTKKILASGANVTGLEPDAELSAQAERAGLQIVRMDAHDMTFSKQFDAVFSNAALHWMHDPERVIANTARALIPGGRFVAEQGGFGNVAAICTAILAALEKFGLPVLTRLPWDFPTLPQQKKRLENAGFQVRSMEFFARQTPLPHGMTGWLRTFIGPFVHFVPDASKDNIIQDIEKYLKPSLCDAEGNWIADYVRLRFVAVKTAAA